MQNERNREWNYVNSDGKVFIAIGALDVLIEAFKGVIEANEELEKTVASLRKQVGDLTTVNNRLTREKDNAIKERNDAILKSAQLIRRENMNLVKKQHGLNAEPNFPQPPLSSSSDSEIQEILDVRLPASSDASSNSSSRPFYSNLPANMPDMPEEKSSLNPVQPMINIAEKIIKFGALNTPNNPRSPSPDYSNVVVRSRRPTLNRDPKDPDTSSASKRIKS